MSNARAPYPYSAQWQRLCTIVKHEMAATRLTCYNADPGLRLLVAVHPSHLKSASCKGNRSAAQLQKRPVFLNPCGDRPSFTASILNVRTRQVPFAAISWAIISSGQKLRHGQKSVSAIPLMTTTSDVVSMQPCDAARCQPSSLFMLASGGFGCAPM